MDKTIKAISIIVLFLSIVLLYGFKTISDAIKTNDQIYNISTEGVAEKIVKSDIAEVRIMIRNANTNFAKLYQKRETDKSKVLEFLSSCGIDSKDITYINSQTASPDSKESSFEGINITSKDIVFTSEDTLLVVTNNFNGVDKIKNQIIKLSSEGIILSYICAYKILNFDNIRTELVTEAAKNAEQNAKTLLAPFNKTITNLNSISNYSDLEVINQTDNDNYYWRNDWVRGEDSLMKRVRQKVSATFSYE